MTLLELSSVALATSSVMTGPGPAILMSGIVPPAAEGAPLAADADGDDAEAVAAADDAADAAGDAAALAADYAVVVAGAVDVVAAPHAVTINAATTTPTAALTDRADVTRRPMDVSSFPVPRLDRSRSDRHTPLRDRNAVQRFSSCAH